VKNLLEIGADIDFEGCPSGSALMAACSYGQFKVVKYLVREGASLCYWGPSGFRSAFLSCNGSAEVLHWLLVGRFSDQSKLTTAAEPGMAPTSDGLRPWSGITTAELVIIGGMERGETESAKQYWSRLMQIKAGWRGKVVPNTTKWRTGRSSRLVPIETVRVHPDGYCTTSRK
jgi:hypothetical protein